MKITFILIFFLSWTSLAKSSNPTHWIFFTALPYSFFLGEYLVSKEFVYSFTSTAITSWTLGTITKCNTTVYLDFSGNNFVGLFTMNSAETKTFTGLPPHWSLSLRMDIILYGSFDSDEFVYVYVDGVQNGKYTKASSNTYLALCNYY